MLLVSIASRFFMLLPFKFLLTDKLDMISFVDRAFHAASCRAILKPNEPSSSNRVILAMRDLETARAGFTPMSLKGVNLHSSAVTWGSVGGLEGVKETLKETLEWPLKYAKQFQKAPLRMTSGILLFGPPGCGKTMLANAVAKECGLHFMSVKGPELLNKCIYI